MPTLTVRNIPEETHRALCARAARNGRSIEAEIRVILEETVRPVNRLKVGSEIHRIASEVGYMDDLKISLRRSQIRGADFDLGK